MVEHSHVTKKPGSFYIPVSTVLSWGFHPHESNMAAAAPGIECISQTNFLSNFGFYLRRKILFWDFSYASYWPNCVKLPPLAARDLEVCTVSSLPCRKKAGEKWIGMGCK